MILTISYLTLRKTLGILALAFPFLLLIAGMFNGEVQMQSSLSAYYWTNAGVLFVSLLVTFSIYLLSYNGYDRRDRWITSAAGISMLLVGLFPMYKSAVPDYLFLFIGAKATGVIHYATAGATFTMLGVMAYFQFTRSNGYPTRNKRRRNVIYRACGIVIFSAIGVMLIITAIPGLQSALNVIKPIFWLESISLWAFGASWLIKGKTLLKDS